MVIEYREFIEGVIVFKYNFNYYEILNGCRKYFVSLLL